MSAPASWTYHVPPKIIFGCGCINQIGDVAKELGGKKAMIVTGSKSMRRHGVIAKVTELLKPIEVETFEAVEPNPSVETYVRTHKAVREKSCNLVIGLGGGSSLDVAKAVAAIGDKDRSPEELFIQPTKIDSRGIPMIAIPTTAGTGSEATLYAMANDPEHGTKKPVIHHLIYPSVSVIDPELHVTMPEDVTAHTGLDAISHAIEAYWAKRAHPITDAIALDALRHMLPNLKKAYDEPANIQARSEMALGALEGGMAISSASTAVVHSISFSLTVRYGLSHGLACALTLPHFLKFNAPSMRNKIPDLLRAMGVETVDEAVNTLRQLMLDTGQPVRLSGLGIATDDIPWIVEHGLGSEGSPLFKRRTGNNPREIAKQDAEELLKGIV